jgi:hypothetical protein
MSAVYTCTYVGPPHYRALHLVLSCNSASALANHISYFAKQRHVVEMVVTGCVCVITSAVLCMTAEHSWSNISS